MLTIDAFRVALISVKRRTFYIRDTVLDLVDPVEETKPPRRYRNVGGGDFVGIGQEFFCYFKEAGLKPTDRVVDIGCGIGRMALPLTDYLTGNYVGIDIDRRAIEWCQQNITARYPKFRFIHADIHNGVYNRKGRMRVSDYKFPISGPYDFVFATSVFTHMLPDGVQHYLDEIKRLLSGTCFATFFLLNDESRTMLRQGKSRLGLRYDFDGCKVRSLLRPENAIGYDEAQIIRWLEDRSLVARRIEYGDWCGRQGRTFQDMVIFTNK